MNFHYVETMDDVLKAALLPAAGPPAENEAAIPERQPEPGPAPAPGREIPVTGKPPRLPGANPRP